LAAAYKNEYPSTFNPLQIWNGKWNPLLFSILKKSAIFLHKKTVMSGA
jgi:hypothetical protein